MKNVSIASSEYRLIIHHTIETEAVDVLEQTIAYFAVHVA